MDNKISIRPTLLLAVSHREALLQNFQQQDGRTWLYVPGYLRRPVGEQVDLEIALAKERMLFHSRGVIRWKRMNGQRSLPAGVGVEFLEEEIDTRDLLLSFCSGDVANVHPRRHRRFPVIMPAECAVNGHTARGQTLDISREGACLAASSELDGTPLDAGQTLQLDLWLPRQREIVLEAKVRWRQPSNAKFGVQFTDMPLETQKRLSNFLAELKRQLAAGG